ncbi:hypothetical protein Tco_1090772 [Tanacetum coccineum]|uniref:Uncharacterized protein n=1 Tax=Tanacetum coccineum TaxID=301880 RepID=A0ABQ5I698_9ASTR
MDEDKDTTELQSLMEVIPDEEEVSIDVVPLATKSLSIVDWKIHKEGKKSYYQIVRAYGKSQMNRVFSQMLKSFYREDLKDLYKLVKAKYEPTRPMEDLDLVLWNDLKTMFKPHVEDEIWKLQQREEQLHALVDDKKIIITESSARRDLQLADEEGIDCLPNSTIFEQLALMRNPKRKDTQIPQSSDPSDNVADEAVHKELGDSLVRVATTASILEAEQDSGNINKTQYKETPNESSCLGTNLGGGPRCQEIIGDTIAQTRFEIVSKHSNDSLLARRNILQSDKDRLKLDELMALCTTLQNRILDLEKIKTSQHNEIASLKRRVKKLEKKNKSRTHRLKRLYKVGLTVKVESFDDEKSLGEDASKQGRIDAIDADEEITLVSVHDMNVSAGEEVVEDVVEVINTAKLIIDVAQVSVVGDKVSTASAATTVSTATTTTATITTVDDITLAQALEEMKSTKPKKKGVIIQELEPVKKKDQILLDEETALNLQAEFDKEERRIKEKAKKEQEANIALIETWDDIQAKIDVDHQLAERLQAQEQEELSVEEKATLF